MIIKALLINDREQVVAEQTLELGDLVMTELELCTKSMMSTHGYELESISESSLLGFMLSVFLRMSSLGIDKFLAEYGKVRLREKTREALEYIPKGP